MTVTFCGHSDFYKTDEYEKCVMDYLEKNIGNKAAEIYLGGYGNFDDFAYHCCKKYKETHSNISLVFVTPYLNESYNKNHLDLQKKKYDDVIYPDIENKPKRVAILYRNKYMVEKADFVIAYVKHDFGGAYTTYKYAKKKEKPIFNLADFE